LKLILIRHGIAEDREEFAQTAQPDQERPLTDDGRKRMKRAARGFRELVEQLDLLATSPLKRAVQTAEIIRKQYDDVAVVVTDSLRPDRPFEEFLAWLLHLEDAQLVAAVGHDPQLSSLASWLLTGNEDARIEMKKGSALLLEFKGEVKAGGAQLLWLLTPAQLRLIGD
jgi:phosphohistidine phosphatase